ncbi:MAG: tetratricopeptide repeat protein [Schleiferiaceae bacterium]|nr:tetratricopeptide repeat protein [Schleiferiaceae bacterium]
MFFNRPAVFLCAILLSSGIFAQNSNLDSLIAFKSSTSIDSQKVNASILIASWYYYNNQLDTVPFILQEALVENEVFIQSKANKTPFYRLKARAYYTWAVTVYRSAQIEDSWLYLDSAIVYTQKVNDRKGLALLYNYCGILSQYESYVDSAYAYYKLCYHEALAARDTNLMIRSTYNRAGIIKRKQQYDEAAEFYHQVEELGELSGRKWAIGDANKGLGDIGYFTSNYEMALKYYGKALSIFELENDGHGLGNTLSNMALVYELTEEYEEAMKYRRRALLMDVERKHAKGIASEYLAIGVLHGRMGNQDSALWYFRKSLILHKEVNYKPGIANSYNNLANKLIELDSLDKALNYLSKAILIWEGLEDEYNLAYARSAYGYTLYKNKRFSEAEIYLKDAYSLSEELAIPDAIRNAAANYSEYLKTTGRYKEAVPYIEESHRIADSLKSEDLKKKSIRTSVQLEYDRKSFQDSISNQKERFNLELAHQEELAEEKQRENIFIGLSILALLAAAALLNRFLFIKKSRSALQKEKDRSDELLLNILPHEVAEELKEQGESEARDFESVTVLFSDFKGFTQASEKLSAKALVKELNACFKAFDEIMGKYQIEKIKTIGDAYMAAGGLHSPRTSEAHDVVLAGLEMQAYMKKRKMEHEKKGRPAFSMRVGIHTGPVVAGIVGVKKFQYDIWGDTVNTASRMESHGVVGKVNLSSTTYELIKDQSEFDFEKREAIEVKGKGEMKMWLVSKPV